MRILKIALVALGAISLLTSFLWWLRLRSVTNETVNENPQAPLVPEETLATEPWISRETWEQIKLIPFEGLPAEWRWATEWLTPQLLITVALTLLFLGLLLPKKKGGK